MITDHDLLQKQATMSLRERKLDLESKFDIHICTCTLWNYYQSHGIKFKAADRVYQAKLIKKNEIQSDQVDFAIKMASLLTENKYEVYFFDETSLHAWLCKNKTWHSAEDQVKIPIRTSRGRSVTILGALGPNGKFIHIIRERTNKVTVIDFLEELTLHINGAKQTIVVLDNHSAHKAKDVRLIAEQKGL